MRNSRPSGSAEIDILIASTEVGWGGGEAQARLLAAGLVERGHRCAVMAPESSPLAHRLAAQGIEVLPLPGRRATPNALMRTRRSLRRWSPHVLHLNDSGAVTAVGIAALGICDTVTVASRRVLFPLRSPWLYRRVARRVLCVSRAVRSECLAAGLPDDMLRVVHDGVVVDQEERSTGGAPPAPRLLSVGSLVACKGHEVGLQSAVALRDDYPELEWLIAGDGPERSALHARVEQLGLGGCVRFLGFRDDVAELMQSSSLLVHAAVQEGLGSSILEAMAAGLAVVVAASGGAADLLPPGDPEPAGWLVAPGDPAALAAAIHEALGDPAERRHRAQRAMQRVRRQFSAPEMVDATLRCYQEVLQGNAS